MSSTIFERAVQRLSPEKLDEVRLSVEVVERIYDLMEKYAINQKELAQKLGKHPSEVNKWLSGTHNFTFKTIIRLENIFGEPILSVSQKTSELVVA